MQLTLTLCCPGLLHKGRVLDFALKRLSICIKKGHCLHKFPKCTQCFNTTLISLLQLVQHWLPKDLTSAGWLMKPHFPITLYCYLTWLAHVANPPRLFYLLNIWSPLASGPRYLALPATTCSYLSCLYHHVSASLLYQLQ